MTTISGGKVGLAVVPDTSGFSTALSGAVSSSAGVLSAAGKVLGGTILAGVTAVAGVAAAGVGMAISGGLNRALNIQDAKAQLTGLGRSTEEVTQIMGNALAAVKGTSFGLDVAAKIAATTVAAGVAPGKELERALRLTADAATIAKVPLNEMGSIMNKVAANGKLSTIELQMFQDRGVPLLQMVAKQYGVTSAAASDMVSQGKVDFAGFQAALEKGVGGSALASGATARGAWANVQAALSRLGAMFVGGPIGEAPRLFTAIGGAVDKFAVALKPAADWLTARIVPAMGNLSTWIDTIDFTKILGGMKGLYDLIVGGNFTSSLREAFGWEEDSGFVTFVFAVRDGIKSLIDGIRTGDMSGFTANLGQVGQVLRPLWPLFVQVAQGIGSVAGSIGGVLAQGIGLLPPILDAVGGALGFLRDNSQLVAPLMAVIVGAFVAYRLSLIASNTANLLGLPIKAASVAAMFAQAAATFYATGATQGATLATRANAAALALQNWSTWSLVKAAIWARTVTIAGAVATGIATAAQWLWNAAMSANPIGIVIIAIVALVAAIVWVATQTTFFQDAWRVMTTVIGTAWNWLWGTVLQPVFNAIGGVFNWLYGNVIQPVVTGILIYVGIWAAIFTWLWGTVVQPVFNAIGDVFNWLYQNVIVPVVGNISAQMNLIGTIFTWLNASVVQPVFQAIGAAFTWVWSNVIRPVADFIGNAVRTVGDTIRAVFGGIAGFIGDSFQNVVGVVRGPLNAIISLVNAAIDGLNSISVTIPAGFPGGGQTFGFNIPRIPMLADGGTITSAGSVIVGERGPELLTLPKGATVNPNIAVGAVSAKPVQVVQNIQLRDEDPRIVARKFGREMVSTLAGMGTP